VAGQLGDAWHSLRQASPLRILTAGTAPPSGDSDEQVQVLASPAELDQLAAETGADRSHDRLHAIELGGGEDWSRYQVRVEAKDAGRDLGGWARPVA
jgi:hypothetical protein